MRGDSGLAKDFQVVMPDHPAVQAARAVKIIPHIPGVFVVLDDHMDEVSHGAKPPFPASLRLKGHSAHLDRSRQASHTLRRLRMTGRCSNTRSMVSVMGKPNAHAIRRRVDEDLRDSSGV